MEMARDEYGQLIPSSVVYLPCVSVTDDAYKNRLLDQVTETPFYTLEMHRIYQVASFNTNAAITPGKHTFQYTYGVSESVSTSISHTLGVSVTVGTSAEAGVPEVGSVGVSVSVTTEYTFGITSSSDRTWSREQTTSIENEVPAGGAGCLFTVIYLYILKRADGNEVARWQVGSTDTHYATYPTPSDYAVAAPH
jgi:hypothetical protein